MAGDDTYDSMVQKKGLAYLDSQVLTPDKTHYKDPIDNSPGRLAGNSHIWGDASPEVQSRAIDAIITASQKGGLNQHETAYVLAIARAESGFNPDAAAGTTTAYGLGQFVDGTGQGYAITPQNKGDLTKQAEALVETYKDDAALAKKYGHGEEYIYKYHHDGPAADYGGLELSKKHIMPYVPEYEKFVQEHAKTHPPVAADPGFDSRNRAEVVHHGAHHAHAAHHAEGILQQGDRSAAVGELQSQLRDLGYTDHKGNPINPDNSFGGDTKAAVQAFQKNHGLDPDGVAGPDTLKALSAQEKALSSNSGPYADPAKATSLNDPLHPGNATYKQIYDGVTKIDAQLGRSPDQSTANLAGALTAAAKEQGLYRVDAVMPSKDGSRMFVVQDIVARAVSQTASVETAQAVNTPLGQSAAQYMRAQAPSNSLAQGQAQRLEQAQVQSQTQTQNPAQDQQAKQAPQLQITPSGR